jgi:hypothetical protein
MIGQGAVSSLISSVTVFWDEIVPPFIKSILNTICGVVSDFLQCVHESVLDDSDREAAIFCGMNPNSLLISTGSSRLVPSLAIAGGSPGCDIQMDGTSDSGVFPFRHRHTHSERFLGNQIAGSRFWYLDDRLTRSPLKHNRAGIHEKGDRNQ